MAKARAKITDEIKQSILADFHTGSFSQQALSDKYKVSIGAINKIVKGLTPKNENLVKARVATAWELSQLSEKEFHSVSQVVDEKTKQIMFFNNSALNNQRLANETLKAIKDEQEFVALSDLDTHSKLTQRNKESVLGKSPDTIINNQNAQISKITREIVDVKPKDS